MILLAKTPRTIKSNLGFLSKLLFSILFALVLIEVGLRAFPGVIPLDLLVLFDEELRGEIAHRQKLPTKKWDSVVIERDDDGPELAIYKPFTERTWTIKETGATITAVMDEIGFCNSPQNSYQLPKIDIIVLGDSFTTCHAVRPKDTWSSQLSILTGKTVYNLGRIGIGLYEYIQLLKKYGLIKSPRVVIMNVYEGNDFRDARIYYESLMNKVVHPEATLSISSPHLQSKFLQHSYVVNLILAAAKYLHGSLLDTTETSKAEVNFKYQLVFNEVSVPFNPQNVDTDEVRNALYLTTLQVDSEVFLVIEEALEVFVNLGRQNDFIPIVTYTPSAYTAYADYVVFDDPKLKGLMTSFSNEQRRYLKLKGEKLGYVFIDLTPSLQATAQSNGSQNLLYYQYDLHLTPAGHAAVANALNQFLQDLDILR